MFSIFLARLPGIHLARSSRKEKRLQNSCLGLDAFSRCYKTEEVARTNSIWRAFPNGFGQLMRPTGTIDPGCLRASFGPKEMS
jgi:hypothetical protein